MNFPENPNKNNWLEVFHLLSNNHQLIKRCLIKIFNDDRHKELPIPPPAKFADSFSDKNIKDILLGGPLYFHEIESLNFPAHWTTSRWMRKEKLAPKQHSQNIENIYQILQSLDSLKLSINKQDLNAYLIN